MCISVHKVRYEGKGGKPGVGRGLSHLGHWAVAEVTHRLLPFSRRIALSVDTVGIRQPK